MGTNDITGDSLTSKPTTDAYAENYDAIFRKPKEDDCLREADADEEKEE